jgi:hypothetical protein
LYFFGWWDTTFTTWQMGDGCHGTSTICSIVKEQEQQEQQLCLVLLLF